jgi:lipopolysaccharide export system permease protein
MHSVFMQHRNKGKLSIINAEHGRFDDLPDGRYIVFEKGERIQGHPGTFNYVVEEFDEYALKIKEKNLSTFVTSAALDSAMLWKSTVKKEVAELQNRLVIPLGIMLLGFIAVPLSRISPRGGVYGSMLLGFLIYFSYGNLSNVAQSWVIKGSIPVWPGIFWVNLVLFVVGLVFLANWYGFRWLSLAIRQRV